MPIDLGTTGEPWTEQEVEAAVSVYFQMLRMQELGQSINKSEINRRLQASIPARNISSIEYKHRNISAVMNLYGVQSLTGYKALPNFQRLLIEVVGRELQRDSQFDALALRSVETPAETPVIDNFIDFIKPIPNARQRTGEPSVPWDRMPIKRDYLERESRNRSLGLAGENLIMEYESRRLHEAGAKALAERIEHVSELRGDGVGYDILSYETSGRERFIEVKTTAYAAETPFFISPNELAFSDEVPDQFHLYRVFTFRQNPRMFNLSGSVGSTCLLEASGYRAMPLGE